MSEEIVLKESPFRTVTLAESGARPVVVKRFHHPGRLGALRDPRRARMEHRALAVLRDAGVRVPEPLSLVTRGRRCELTIEAIPGATSLDTILEDATRALDWTALAPRLGRLLGALHGARVDHPDLHPGNVVLDEAGEPWLVDFHAARVRSGALSKTTLARDLVDVTAHAREHVAGPHRRAFLRAWWSTARSLGPRVNLDEGWLRALLPELESRARARRRARIAAWAGRWMRASSRCRPTATGGYDCPPLHRHGESGHGNGDDARHRIELPPDGAARDRWRIAVRLFEHHLPVLRPRRFEPAGGTRGGAWLELTAGTRALPDVALDQQLDHWLGRLLGLLHDRGLDVDGLGAGDLVTVAGRTFLLPPERLREHDPLRPRRAPFAAVAASLGARPSDEFRAAYRDVFADRPAEAERIAQLTG